MGAFEFLIYFDIALPFWLAIVLLCMAPSQYRGSLKLLATLVLLCEGCLGSLMAIRAIVAFTPLRPILLVPQEYMVLTQNLETIFISAGSIVMSVVIARRFVFPRWHAVIG